VIIETTLPQPAPPGVPGASDGLRKSERWLYELPQIGQGSPKE